MHDGGEASVWFRLVVAALATWRLTHLLVLEDGPFDLVVRLRGALGRAGRVLDCFYCCSIWIAAPLALFVTTRPLAWLCVWPALSGAACLAHRASEPSLAQDDLSPLPADRGEVAGGVDDLPPRPAERGEVAGRRPAGEGNGAASERGPVD